MNVRGFRTMLTHLTYAATVLTTVVTCWQPDELAAAELRDLIIVAGQSNAVGYDAQAAELPEDPSDRQVMFWWRCGDPPPDTYDSSSARKWTTLQPQTRGKPLAKDSNEPGEQRFGLRRQYGNFRTAGGFGPEIGLARELAKRENRMLAVVKVAFSGTGIRSDWSPTDKGDSGACYRALVTEVAAARAAARSRDVELQPRALVWVQGESDSNAKDAPHYERALAQMLAALRKELAAPQLIALVSLNTRFGNGENKFVPVVVRAQQAVAGAEKLTVYVDTDGAETLPPRHTHFTTRGTLEIGRRFAAALAKAEAGRAGVKTEASDGN